MNQEEIDFANEDLGLAPVHGDDDVDGDDFDAFNEDTFGAEDVWVEDDHEELAKFTEEEFRGIQETESFFDFDNERSAQNGRRESPRMSALADAINDNLKISGPIPSAQHGHQPHVDDPAIMNVMRFPPMPHYMPSPMPQFPGGLNDPAIMSLSQIPPQHILLLQQQQQQQQLLQQQMMRQPPPPQQQPPMLQPRTVEDIEREILAEQEKRNERQHQLQQQARFQQHLRQQHQHQQQQQQHQYHHHHQQHQHQRHQHHHQQHHQHQHQFQQYQHRGNMNQGWAQNQRNRNPFDDKNRETFGDAFVEHHHAQHRRQQDNLITPGHVHVLGILRGARERRGHGNQGPGMAHESTGNPMRDRELERLADSRRFGHDGSARPDPDDEYAGLMNQRERQWIVNIQLSQLKCENPFLDDYYFTVFNLRKQHQQYISARNADNSDPENNPEKDPEVPCRAKPEEEGAQLLIQPDSPRNPYTPLQFSNSLGKLQAATVKAPRKIIDVGILNSDASETAAQKDSRNFKLTLLELERLYNLLIEVEDCEKKLLALPTNTPMRIQVETERDDAVKKFGVNLTGGNRLKRYLTVRKGKTLMKRGLRLLDDLQLGLVCTNLMQHFASILRKDREEQILTEFWDHGLRKHLLGAPFELVHHYLTVIAAKTYSIKPMVTSGLGSSILIAIIHRAAILSFDQNENSEEIKNLVTALAGKLAEATDLSPPLKSFNLQLPACGLAANSLQQLERLQRIAISIK